MELKKIILIQVLVALAIIGGYFVYVKATYQPIPQPKKTSYSWLVGLENRYGKQEIPGKFFKLINIDNKEISEPDSSTAILVFRFSQIYCGTCVTREVRLLREFAGQIGWDQIIFVATNSDEEYLNQFKRASRVDTEIYNVDPQYFPLDTEPLDTPYMFILDSDSTFKELFISMKENEVRTKQYLDKISSYF